MSLSSTNSQLRRNPPPIRSRQDLTIFEVWDSGGNRPDYVAFFLVTPDEQIYFGRSYKSQADITLAEYTSALEYVDDEEIYPETPKDIALTIEPDKLNLTDASTFIKRPGLYCYDIWKNTNFIPKEFLNEVLIMEQVTKIQHPNIVRYFGCRVRRGRLIAIVLERLDQTLTQYASTPAFQQLDKVKFIEALESAVDALHSLGLAHNDINPHNIMVKDGIPVLIDFGSCQPFGHRLQSAGTPGWYEELFHTSEKKHDTYSMGKLREWLQK